jgi:hypothetical protein
MSLSSEELRHLLEDAQVAVALAATQNTEWVALWQRIEVALDLLRTPAKEARDD